MRVSCLRLLAVLALLPTATVPGRGQDRDDFEARFRKFAGAYCVDCHGPDVQRSKLRLDTLPLGLTEKDTAATWAKVCQAMGPEFEPYLPVVMPPLFRAANAKADVSVYGLDCFYCVVYGRTDGE